MASLVQAAVYGGYFLMALPAGAFVGGALLFNGGSIATPYVS